MKIHIKSSLATKTYLQPSNFNENIIRSRYYLMFYFWTYLECSRIAHALNVKGTLIEREHFHSLSALKQEGNELYITPVEKLVLMTESFH